MSPFKDDLDRKVGTKDRYKYPRRKFKVKFFIPAFIGTGIFFTMLIYSSFAEFDNKFKIDFISWLWQLSIGIIVAYIVAVLLIIRFVPKKKIY